MTDEAELRRLIKEASDTMRSDDNTKNALAYLEQLTWLLFLKQYDALEDERELTAQVDERTFERVIDGKYRWAAWARSGLTGDPLIAFVNNELLPYLKGLAGSPGADRVARLFDSVTTVMKSGHALREVIDKVDQIDFHAVTDAHTLSVIYETLLSRTSDAGWSGEFYTPRTVVDAMVSIAAPKLGQTVYDPCSGSCGFLVGAHAVIGPQADTVEEQELVSARTFYAQESGGLAYFVGTMNLMLHGIDEPQTIRRNSLEQDIRSIPPSEQHDLIFTNPPFGGEENPQVQQNFPARSAATELLFLQHCMAKLKRGGTCAIVLPDGALFREDQAFLSVRRRLLTEFSVDGIIRLPQGVFPTAPDARTNLVFFRRTGEGTKSVRFYLLRPPNGRARYSKNYPLAAAELDPAVSWLRDGTATDHGWAMSYEEIVASGYDLNPRPRLVIAGTDVPNPLDLVEHLKGQADAVQGAADRWRGALDNLTDFEVGERVSLEQFVVERGRRAGDEEAEPLVGVTNAGGLAPFKGKASASRNRYRRLEAGDFVYNPMRVNVGSLALCRYPNEEGWVSPDYVVFRLEDDAPFSSEYLLFFLTSAAGRDEINRHTQGSIRARLYYENLTRCEVPVPANPGVWDEFLQATVALRSTMARSVGPAAASDLAAALFT